jgi:hypothetical protein
VTDDIYFNVADAGQGLEEQMDARPKRPQDNAVNSTLLILGLWGNDWNESACRVWTNLAGPGKRFDEGFVDISFYEVRPIDKKEEQSQLNAKGTTVNHTADSKRSGSSHQSGARTHAKMYPALAPCMTTGVGVGYPLVDGFVRPSSSLKAAAMRDRDRNGGQALPPILPFRNIWIGTLGETSAKLWEISNGLSLFVSARQEPPRKANFDHHLATKVCSVQDDPAAVQHVQGENGADSLHHM